MKRVRTRNKSFPDSNVKNGSIVVFDALAGYSYHSVDLHASASWFSESSSMTDYHSPTLYQCVDHLSIERTMYGSVGGPLFGNHCPPSCTNVQFTFIPELILGNSRFTYYPVRSILQDAVVAFPNELGQNPNSDGLPLWQSRYANLNNVKPYRVSLNSGFDLVNFLLHWKEAVQIAKHYGSPSSILHKFHSVMKDLAEGSSLSVKRAANEWLEWQYGVSLFARDAKRLFEILSTWKQHADRLAKLSGVPQFHTAKLQVSPDPGTVYKHRAWTPFGVTDLPQTLELSYTQHIEAHATFVYKYSMPNVVSWFSRLGQLSDSLGVSLDPSVVWNAIPFSFVVDWFYNVSEWLHDKRIDWTSIETSQLEFGKSARFKVARNLNLISKQRDALHPDGRTVVIPLYSDEYVRYERRLDHLGPNDVQFESNEHWTVTRALNATALAVQKAASRGVRFN